MARSSADDLTLKKQCEAAIISSGGGNQKVVLCIRAFKSHAVWGKPAKLARQMAKPRVLAISTKFKGQKTKAFLRVLKESDGGTLEAVKIYKLKHLSKVEVMESDASGCTFMMGFDNLRSQIVPPQWMMRNKDDRNRIIVCLLNSCKEVLGSIPKVVGIDIVEMAFWAKENSVVKPSQEVTPDGPVALPSNEREIKSEGMAVERDLVFQAEEEDMEALLGTYLMGFGEAEAFSERMKRELLALESANVHAILETESVVDEVLRGLEVATICMEDMDEWLAIFNVKLRHMREDIESIEYRNNRLEFQSENNKALMRELDKLLEHLQIPSEYETALTVGSFDEGNMSKNIEACEWLTNAIRDLELPNLLDPSYAKLRAVREKRAEFILLRCTFVSRASEFLTQYFPTLIDYMINDQSNLSQKGQLKRPDHAELRYKCRVYARLLKQIKSLDDNCMGPLRMSYCQSLNQLLRKEISCFANELRASVRVARNNGIPLEGPFTGQAGSYADSRGVSEAYAKLINVFVPLLVDESTFFSHLMCFETSSPESSCVNAENTTSGHTAPTSCTSGNAINAVEMVILNDCLRNMLNGVQDDFFAIIDWAANIDVWCCITIYGITDGYLAGHKADNVAFVHALLGDLENRIESFFAVFIDDSCYQVEKYEKNAKIFGVLAYIPRFAQLAMRLEEYRHRDSRDLIDQAYNKIVSTMFVTLEKMAQVEPKYSDIMLLENYAAFQNGLYDLANNITTLAKLYHQASEAYEQACLRHINMVIYIHYEKLFQFARRTEELLTNKMPPEELVPNFRFLYIPFQMGMSKGELRKILKSTLSALDKTQSAMYKKLQKNLTVEELIPSLWEKCKREFLQKYASFIKMVQKIYPSETIPSEIDMQKILQSLEAF